MRNLGAFALFVILSGCGSTSVQQVTVKEAITITDPSEVKPIAITKVAAKMRRGSVVGELRQGWACIKHSDIKWRTGTVNLSSEELVDVFRDELDANGWPVVGSTDDLFAGYDVSGAEVLVAARLNDLETQLCAPNAGFYNYDLKGSMRMDVEWQVYSPARRQLIGTVTTSGSAELKNTSDDAAFELLSESFAVAANNLLASRDFLSLVERSEGLIAVPDALTGAVIENKRPNFQTMEAAIASVKRSTVTIRIANAHGSGVVVGDGSYVFTNAHVVGDAQNVTLVTHGGIEIPGRVQVVSKERDIALIRIDALKLPAAHIEPSLPGSGARVFAIGSPLSEQMQGSVTSGIVSGTRIMDGYEWIQSDTAISPGNSGGPLINDNGSVVAISTAGFQAGGTQVGLNLFIPIADALTFTQLRVQ